MEKILPKEKAGLADACEVSVSVFSVTLDISACLAASFSLALSAISSSVSNAVSNFSTRFSSRLRSCSNSSFEAIRGLGGEDKADKSGLVCLVLTDVLTISDIRGKVMRVPALDGVLADDEVSSFCCTSSANTTFLVAVA